MSETMPCHTTAEALEAATQALAQARESLGEHVVALDRLARERANLVDRVGFLETDLRVCQQALAAMTQEREMRERAHFEAQCELIDRLSAAEKERDAAVQGRTFLMGEVTRANEACRYQTDRADAAEQSLAAMTQERDALARRYERRKRAAVEVWGRTLLRLDAAEQSLAEVRGALEDVFKYANWQADAAQVRRLNEGRERVIAGVTITVKLYDDTFWQPVLDRIRHDLWQLLPPPAPRRTEVGDE